MKQIKPHIIVAYLAGILLLLVVFSYLIPSRGWQLGTHRFSFIHIEKLVDQKDIEKKDIQKLLQKTDTTMQVVNLDSLALQKADTVPTQSTDTIKNTDKKTDKTLPVSIVYNAKAKAYLHQFFRLLSKAKRKRLSILHYGDSQIESDRITSYLRQKAQLQFGGKGPGLIPATEVYNMYTFQQEYSENFVRYTAFGGKKLKSGKYGAMASASRFTEEFDLSKPDFQVDSLPVVQARISISPSKRAYSRARLFTRVSMHYNDCIDSVQVKIFQGDKLVKQADLIPDAQQHSLSVDFIRTPEKISFAFSGRISPNICGFSLEGDRGLQFSNIGLRGNDGMVFTRIKYASLSGMMHEVNAQLVLMQFGGNSVVVFKDSTQVRSYANRFKLQIKRVQKAMPGSMVIVIGPSDMSKLTDGVYKTYPFLPYCVDEMKRVALETNAGFWSLYDAMGGENSMPSWVEKGLAAKDYVHFSNKGAKFAAQLFWQAFIDEYVKWKKPVDNRTAHAQQP